MPTNIHKIIQKLSPTRRKNVEARAAELIAEETARQKRRRARKRTKSRA